MRINSYIHTPGLTFNAPIYNDYLVPGLALATGASAPGLDAFRGSLYQRTFAGTGAVVEQGFFTVHILHDICPLTYPTFHVHCGHNISSGTYTPGTASVKWYIDYSIAKGYEQESFASPTTTSTTVTMNDQYSHHITNDDDMTLSVTLEPDTLILGRVYRDPAQDDFAYDCFLFQIDLHYQIGQIGTPERNAPFTTAFG